ncbi:hypothetical protein F5Y11DRAFT_75995 [Daldinia sp. FL1419]|nr:hypothetical protein F5Y11DRAFT_75995 [Daldinia sp. FL1419]
MEVVAKVAKRVTLAAVMVTCLASASTVASAITVVRTVTSRVIALSPRLVERRFATSASSLATSSRNVLTRWIHLQDSSSYFCDAITLLNSISSRQVMKVDGNRGLWKGCQSSG